jgi:DNA-binding NtrC family response regulator
MSQLLPEGTSDNIETVDQHTQASATETIGVTYIPSSESSTLRRIVWQAELQMIARTLEDTGWNRKRAAAQLKISYRGLLYKIRRHGLRPPTRAGQQS